MQAVSSDSAQGSNKLERQRKLEAHKRKLRKVEEGFLETNGHKTLWQTYMDAADI
jgi:hypothetical protein